MRPHRGESERRTRLANAFRTHAPPLPPSSGPAREPRRLEVFATGTDRVQLTWSVLGPGPVSVRAGAVVACLEADGGPGAVTVTGLGPDAHHDVEVSGPGLGDHGPVVLGARTLARPSGALLHRLVTVSDVHLGSTGTGYFNTIIEKPEPETPHPQRCFAAALEEATAWGADAVVVKGDLVDANTDEAWRHAGDVLSGFELPVHLVPGNHEWVHSRVRHPADAIAELGLHLEQDVGWRDLPGLRLVLVDTSVPGTDWGQVAAVTDHVADVVAGTAGPALIAMHHHPMRFRLPAHLPPGIPGPEARRFLSTVGRANPRTLVTSGHTHRHRRREHGPVTVTEVGSTKDFPGTWAGYEVYEGGLVQTVHRIERPDCIRWTDHTRRAAGGLWQLWSPGRLDDRCFTRCW